MNLYFAGKLIRTRESRSAVVDTAVVMDRQGSVRVRTNLQTGAVTQLRYYPFGEEQQATAQDYDKYATYYRDATSGLDYAWNRYYSSTTARFLTPDPFDGSADPENPLSWNRYSYVENDPINYNDPSGLLRPRPRDDTHGGINGPSRGGSGFDPFNPGSPCPGYAGCGWDAYNNHQSNQGANGGESPGQREPSEPSGGSRGIGSSKPKSPPSFNERMKDLDRQVERCISTRTADIEQQRRRWKNDLVKRVAKGARNGPFWGMLLGLPAGPEGVIVGLFLGPFTGAMGSLMWEYPRNLLADRYYDSLIQQARRDCAVTIYGRFIF